MLISYTRSWAQSPQISKRMINPFFLSLSRPHFFLTTSDVKVNYWNILLENTCLDCDENKDTAAELYWCWTLMNTTTTTILAVFFLFSHQE